MCVYFNVLCSNYILLADMKSVVPPDFCMWTYQLQFPFLYINPVLVIIDFTYNMNSIYIFAILYTYLHFSYSLSRSLTSSAIAIPFIKLTDINARVTWTGGTFKCPGGVVKDGFKLFELTTEGCDVFNFWTNTQFFLNNIYLFKYLLIER